MSTIACAAIQILDPTVGILDSWKTEAGSVFLDVFQDFDFGLTKNVEELTEINELQLSGVYGFSIPKSPKNQAILLDWIEPNTFDFSGIPVNVRAYVGGSVLSQRYLYVRESRWRDGTIECALTNNQNHWAIAASRLKLNEIPYDYLSFDFQTVIDNMQQDAVYNNGDAGIYFQLANYGNLFLQRRVSVEYMRPWYHLLGILQKGFKYIGWKFESTIFETPIGRQIICYLLDPEYYNVYSKDRILIANITPFLIAQIYTNDDVGKPREELLNYDVIVDDPSGSYVGGRYYGFGEYLVEASLLWNNFYQVYHTVTIQIIKYKNINSEPEVIREITGQAKNNYAEDREISIKSQDAITLLPGEWIELRYKGESNGVSSWRDNILGGTLKITPTKQFPTAGETINPGLLLRKDSFLDLCKGALHLIRGKVETLEECNIVRFLPNYKVDYYGTDAAGFYFDGDLIVVNSQQIERAEVTRPPDFTQARYKLLKFKSSTDTLVKQLEEGLQYPLHSKLFDIGDQFKDETETFENPYFEATANDWVTNWSRIANGIPMDIPHCLDHKIEDDKVQFSTNIGPRVIITKGWQAVRFKAQNGTLWNTQWDFGNHLAIFQPQTSYPWGFNLALGTLTGDPPDESMVYGERDDDLYNKFWKRWAFETFKNFIVDLLVWLTPPDYQNWGLRNPYSFLTGGQTSFGSLLSISNFQPCRQVPTQALFRANASTVGQYPEEPTEEDPCDTYYYELSWTEAGGVYTFSVDTDSPGPITIEWRYHDVTTWTVGNVVSNPDRLFYVRVRDGACNDAVVKIQPIDPCGENFPTLIITYRYDDTTMEHCVTATIGGIIEDVIDSTTFTVSIDSGTPVAYTIGTEVCGAVVDFCFSGEVQFLNDCDPIPLEQCFEVPPVVVNCEDNVPEIGYHHIGLDAYQLLLNGTWVSPPATWHFQFRDIGDDDAAAQIWDTKSPINKETFEARVVMYFCDTCPKVCSPWVVIPNPGPLKMSMSQEWDFGKLTDDDWKLVKELISKNDLHGLMKLHNDKKLSSNHYCCGRDGVRAKNWFEYGLELRK